MDQTDKIRDKILETHYSGAIKVILDVIKLVGNNKVVEICGEYDDCLSSFPCQGHGNAIIDLENGNKIKIYATSVQIGALQVFYFPNIKSDASKYHYTSKYHYVDYITDEFSEKLRMLAQNKKKY
jgi:hypothetical protein